MLSVIGTLLRSSDSPAAVVECRHCGRTVDAGTRECDTCGRAEIARYELS